MDSKGNINYGLHIATGIFLAGALTSLDITQAGQNPFNMIDLPGGYQLAEQENTADKTSEGKCGAAKSGGKAEAEAVCGIYQVGSSHRDDSKVKDGKCGGHKVVEASCGGDR